jgi:hypothetical protein
VGLKEIEPDSDDVFWTGGLVAVNVVAVAVLVWAEAIPNPAVVGLLLDGVNGGRVLAVVCDPEAFSSLSGDRAFRVDCLDVMTNSLSRDVASVAVAEASVNVKFGWEEPESADDEDGGRTATPLTA